MQLARNTVATLFEINSPIWNGDVGKRVVGLAKHRLTKHNEIHFMYRRKSDGELSIPDVFYFDGDKQSQYKTQTIKGTTLVLVLFDDIEEVETAEATRRRMNAIKWLMAKGYRPAIGGLKNLRQFELVNKDTGETEVFDINSVLAEYDQERKDEARARAAERRLQQKGGRNDLDY